jgi:hypothetical protein
MGFLIFIFVILWVLIRRSVRDEIQPFQIKAIPKFKLIDINNRKIESHQFKGKATFIEFINSRDPNDMDLFFSVYNNWNREDLNILVGVKDAERFLVKIGRNFKNIFIVQKDYEYLAKKFKLFDLNGGLYCIVDKKGTIIGYGGNKDAYDKEVKVQLQQVINEKAFNIYDFLDYKNNLNDIKWLRQIGDLLNREDKKYYLISLYTKICNNCSEGTQIESLKKIYSKYNEYISVIFVLLDVYTQKDILNMRSQLSLICPIYIADVSLSQKWKHFIGQYRENDLTDIILLVDKAGKILEVADRKCNCWGRLFNKTTLLLESKAW